MATDKEPKLTASEKRAQKRRETAAKMEQVFGTGKGSTEPTINPLDYTISLMHALNYYNAAYENKDKRKWFMSYVGKKSSEFDDLSDWEFRSVGTLIRLKQREQPLTDKDLQFIEDTIKELRVKAKEGKKYSTLKGEPKEKEVKPTVSIQDRMVESASTHIGEINGLIDDFITNDAEMDVASYLKANNVSPQVAKFIPPAFEKTLEELEELLEGKDKQLVEGYSYLTKTQIKNIVKFVELVLNDLNSYVSVKKAKKTPRVRKAVPVEKIVAKLKYLKISVKLSKSISG